MARHASTAPMTDVVISRVDSSDALDAWIDVPRLTLPLGAAYVPPLRHTERRRLSRTHNPFFKHADVELFTASQHGRLVGRISTQVNQHYLEQHKDGRGQFGFFDSVDDQEV